MADEKYASGDGGYAEWCDESRPDSEFVGHHYAEVRDDGSGRIQSVLSTDASPDTAAAADNVTDAADEENLSAKEKKQRQKEAKAREKKEKAETQRKLKEQEKQIKEEAKRKQETPAERRHRQRMERNKAQSDKRSGVSRVMSPLRPAKNMTQCRVRLLDGTDYQFDIESSAKGCLLVDMVCEHVNVLEKDYFSCSYNDAGVKYWIILDRRIAKQIGTRDWVFEFGVKYYVPEPVILQEEITRYQLCLQLRANIVSGKLPCSLVTAALLGAYTVQSELGSYDAREFGSGVDYLRDFQFSPQDTEELLNKVHEIHRSLASDQFPAEADLNYLNNATKMELYGVELQDAQDAELIDISVGVCSQGLVVYRGHIRINLFPWPLVLKMSYKKDKFDVKIRPAAGESFITTLTFKMPSCKLTKRFWRLAAETHSFFRLKCPLPADRGVFTRFGSSRHRFIGRTFHQSATWSATVTRPQPYFERTASRMTTSLTTSSFMEQKAREVRRKELESEGGGVGEVSVVAGSGSDPAGRVAYVKTVHAAQPPAADAAVISHEAPHPHPHPAAAAGMSDEAGRRQLIVSADINTTQRDQSAESVELDSAEHKKKKKKQKKKTETKKSKPATTTTNTVNTTTTTTTQNAYSDDEGNVVTKPMLSAAAVDRNGGDEVSGAERRQITGRQDIDHDYELSRAITNVVQMDTDLSVDQIEINPSDVAATMSAQQERIHIAPVKKPKPITKPKPASRAEP